MKLIEPKMEQMNDPLVTPSVTTLALGSQLRQRLARARAKREA
jgi:hypothetical protein